MSASSLLSLVLAGCAGPEEAAAPGSATILPTADGDDLYLLDTDEAELVWYSPSAGTMRTSNLESTPGRLTRAGKTIWVTLPEARSIAVVEDDLFALNRVGTIPTGADPFGIVANVDGTRLYVALRDEGEVQELSTDGEVLRSWAVEGQPSWLGLSPDGGGLYVGSAIGGHLTWVDLVGGTTEEVILPAPLRADEGNRAFTQRVTGDLAVSADGDLLGVPLLLVDHFTTGGTPDAPNTTSYYVNTNTGLGRFNPTIALVHLDADGRPDGPGASLVLVATDLIWSYPSSVSFAPDGSFAVATMEASASAVAFSTRPST